MFKPSALVIAFSALAQLIGFLRTAVIAEAFGTSTTLDAYYLALVLPTFVVAIVSGLLQVSFVPVYVQMQVSGSSADSVTLRSTIFWLVVALSTALWTIFALSADFFLTKLAPGSPSETLAYASGIMPFAASVLLLNTIADFVGLLLNSHNRFALAAAAPALNALISSAVLLFLASADLTALVSSLLIGWGGQVMVLVCGLRPLKLNFPLRHIRLAWGLPLVLRLGAPILPGVVFSTMIIAFLHGRAASLGPGELSIFGYAWRLYSVPTQVLVLSLSTVLLPHFSRLVAEKKDDEVIRTFSALAKTTLLASSYLLALIYSYGPTYIDILLGRGEFGHTEATAVSHVLLAFLCNIFLLSYGTFLSRLLTAHQKPAILSISSGIALAVVLAVCFPLVESFDVAGLAFALLLGYACSTAFLQVIASRLYAFPFDVFSTAIFLLKASAALGISIAAAAASSDVISFPSASAIFGGVVLTVVYGVLVRVMGLVPALSPGEPESMRRALR
ncbi:MAG: lipid II flippase MurJ [Gammaproteobacteria bacterium]